MEFLKMENPSLADDPDQLRNIQLSSFATWFREEVIISLVFITRNHLI